MIREYIRQIIKEAMVAAGSLGDNIAIWGSWYEGANPEAGTELDFLMYDLGKTRTMVDRFDDAGGGLDTYELMDSINGSTLAVMRVRIPGEDLYGECNQAWEVIRSAAEEGYGPTLYDIIMSISPYGLTSDRNSVSQAARGVWSYYANNRSAVDKQYLDGRAYTANEEDDCLTHGSGPADDLIDLTRIMAVNYFKDYYPYEYETFTEEIDPEVLMDWGSRRGDEFYELVSGWIEDHAEKFEFEDWDIDEANDNFYMYRYEEEPNLINDKDGEFDIQNSLNMSYNTDYAAAKYEDLSGNHYNFMAELMDRFSETFEEPDYEMLHFSVSSFFREKY